MRPPFFPILLLAAIQTASCFRIGYDQECGDDKATDNEACDGADVRGQTCVSLGFAGGTLACTAACQFDFSRCAAQCGNGRQEGTEDCDGLDLGGRTCTQLGFSSGTLTCNDACQFVTGACTVDLNGRASVVFGVPGEILRIVQWDIGNQTWQPALEFTLTGEVAWVLNRVSPDALGTEIVAAMTATATDTRLHLLSFDAQGWHLDESFVLNVPVSDSDKRVFDLQFSSDFQQALLVYSIGTSTPQYRTYDVASGWSPGQPILAIPPNTGEVRWLELAAHPFADEQSLLYVDSNGDITAVMWNGLQWVSASAAVIKYDSGYPSSKPFSFSYEHLSGNLRGFCGDAGAMTPRQFFKQHGEIDFIDIGQAVSASARHTHDQIVPHKDSNQLLFLSAYSHEGVVFDGAGWQPNGGSYDYPSQIGRSISGAWLIGGHELVIAFNGNRHGGSLPWVQWRPSTGWSADKLTEPFAGLDEVRRVQLTSFPAEDRLFALFADDTQQLWAATYDPTNGWSLAGSGPLHPAIVSPATTQPFTVAIWQGP